jgi:hypothetical protein
MRIKVKGLHWTLAKLADGAEKIYWYAWKNGPRIHGEYGSPDFIASYNEAIAQRAPTAEGRLQSLIQGYQRSQKFLARSERTREDYVRQIGIIEKEFGDFPLRALAARETRSLFMDWRDKLALSDKAGIVDVTFNDLRGTAVTRLALVAVAARPRSPPSPATACATCARSWTRTT